MGTFLSDFNQLDWFEIAKKIDSIEASQVDIAIQREGRGGLEDFIALISPLAGEKYLEDMAQLSNRLTKQRFGKVIRLFAPIYLSNECNNICDYCGFSLGNKIPRKTLSTAEILKEAGALRSQGFEHVLLVTGESTRKVGRQYLFDAISLLGNYFSNISIEVQPLSMDDYNYLISAGLHAVLVYQETYNKQSYAAHHIKGKKTNFNWRLETPDRLGQAGINKIGLGCLYGLTKEWRVDSFMTAMHLDYLEKKYWRTTFSMSFPRIRPYEGEIEPIVDLSDKNLVQLICAYRIFNHELELSLSTRESAFLREKLLPLGITTMSAGSKTNPGGYTVSHETLEQFSISDSRSPDEVAEMLTLNGYESVWKDWDSSYDFVNKKDIHKKHQLHQNASNVTLVS